MNLIAYKISSELLVHLQNLWSTLHQTHPGPLTVPPIVAFVSEFPPSHHRPWFQNVPGFSVLVVIQKLISVVQMSWNLGGWLTLLKKSHRLEHLADGITWQVKEVFKRNLWSGRFDDVSCCSCVHDKWISYRIIQSKFIICHCHQSFLYVHRVCKTMVAMPSKRNMINICVSKVHLVLLPNLCIPYAVCLLLLNDCL